jgi:hypothetical protein
MLNSYAYSCIACLIFTPAQHELIRNDACLNDLQQGPPYNPFFDTKQSQSNQVVSCQCQPDTAAVVGGVPLGPLHLPRGRTSAHLLHSKVQPISPAVTVSDRALMLIHSVVHTGAHSPQFTRTHGVLYIHITRPDAFARAVTLPVVIARVSCAEPQCAAASHALHCAVVMFCSTRSPGLQSW